MALRAGSVGLHPELASQDVDWWKPLGAKWRVTAWPAKADQQATNSQLITETDMGNPTV